MIGRQQVGLGSGLQSGTWVVPGVRSITVPPHDLDPHLASAPSTAASLASGDGFGGGASCTDNAVSCRGAFNEWSADAASHFTSR
jgi:hypothetical protein